MIIPTDFSNKYDNYEDELEIFKSNVDAKLDEVKKRHPDIGVNSRIKDKEGLFVKSLLGEAQNPFTEIIDFFACVISVPRLSDIPGVAKTIEEVFEVVSAKSRKMEPHEFRYSDLHFVLKLRDDR